MHAESVAAALEAIRRGDAQRLKTLLDGEPELVRVEVGAGGSLLGEVAEPDVFGTCLRHELAVDRACVELLIARGSDLDGPLNLAACFDPSSWSRFCLRPAAGSMHARRTA